MLRFGGISFFLLLVIAVVVLPALLCPHSMASAAWTHWGTNIMARTSYGCASPMGVRGPSSMIMFGGFVNGSESNLVRVWDAGVAAAAGPSTSTPLLEGLTTITTNLPPSRRHSHTCGFDPTHNKLVVVGGILSTTIFGGVSVLTLNPAPLNSTWGIGFQNALSPRLFGVFSAMDTVNSVFYWFGGTNSSHVQNGLFAYNVTREQELSLSMTTTTRPPGRTFGSLVFSPSSNTLLLFGGFNGSTSIGDLWKCSISPYAWTRASHIGGPQARNGHWGVFVNSSLSPLLPGLYIGYGYNSNFLQDIWRLNDDIWTPLDVNGCSSSATPQPGARWTVSVAPVSFYGGTALAFFGGANNTSDAANSAMGDGYSLCGLPAVNPTTTMGPSATASSTASFSSSTASSAGAPIVAAVTTLTSSTPSATMLTTTSATGVSSTATPVNVDSATSSSAPFPLWVLGVIAGVLCCCCLVLGMLAFLRRSASQGASTTAFADVIDDDAVCAYDTIAGLDGDMLSSEGNLRQAVDIAEEQNYARIRDVGAVEGTYAKIPDFKAHASAGSIETLAPTEILIDSSRRVGHGEFGDVYRGQYRGVDVAIKMLKSGYTTKALRDFYDEAAVIAAVPEHEFIVGFVGVTPDPFMIITEFCNQGSLLRYLKSSAGAGLSNEQSLKVIKDVASGMAHLASHRIVHRDLAARNILLTSSLVPKITDFGLSRSLEEGASRHQSKTAMGPVRWMSVEAIRKGYFSEASDVWAFAVTAFECLSRGDIPYGRDVATMEVARSVLSGKRLQFPATISATMAELFQSCMSDSPSDRPTFAQIVERMDAQADKVVYASLKQFATQG